MKKTVVFLLLLFVFAVPVRAEDIYSYFETEKIEEALPEDAKEILSEYGIDSKDITEKLDSKGFLTLVGDFLKNGFNGILGISCSVLSLVLISSLMSSFSTGTTTEAVETVCLLSCSCVLITGIYSCISAALQTIKGAFAFMTAAVPVYMGLMITASKPVSAASAGGVLLLSCQVMSTVFSFVLTPVMNGYLAVGVCSAFSGEKGVASLMDTLKKAGMWFYSLCTSVFLFLLSVNSVAGSVKDNLVMKTAKFVLGTAVPVAGAALSESASAVAASVNLMRGSVGIYILICVAVIVLPLVCSLIFWRFSMLVIKNVSDILSCFKLSVLFSVCEAVISLLLGFVLLSLALITISMGVLIKL
ncbi:MAG: hypothetical protein U0M42_09470 [Acutalibacteraceae bacterium]|nr:hypothetical protein [Acutalibacteraceae bacterium]